MYHHQSQQQLNYTFDPLSFIETDLAPLDMPLGSYTPQTESSLFWDQNEILQDFPSSAPPSQPPRTLKPSLYINTSLSQPLDNREFIVETPPSQAVPTFPWFERATKVNNIPLKPSQPIAQDFPPSVPPSQPPPPPQLREREQYVVVDATPLRKKRGRKPGRKRKSSATSASPPPTKRQRKSNARGKVAFAKGALQCRGKNKKKNDRCRNAALMEFIGPRPLYCAEHIEQDPNALYQKCRSSYQKVPGDGKGCKEVVLKEFGVCHKHFKDVTEKLTGPSGYSTTERYLARVVELLEKLEREAASAKKYDGDLYQRKHKLIPKFQMMKQVLLKHLSVLEMGEKKECTQEEAYY